MMSKAISKRKRAAMIAKARRTRQKNARINRADMQERIRELEAELRKAELGARRFVPSEADIRWAAHIQGMPNMRPQDVNVEPHACRCYNCGRFFCDKERSK